MFPSQRPQEIALQVDPVESFRFEKVVTSDGDAYRIRSDVSMLLHTASDGSLIQWPFFKVNPNTLDDIFAVKADSTWETDQFLVNAYVGCKVVRNLS